MINYPQTNLAPPIYLTLTNMTDIGRWIEEKRKDLGLKRPEFCSTIKKHFELDISIDYLYKIESGNRRLDTMNVELREAIRKTLKITPEEWQARTGLFTPEDMTPTAPTTKYKIGAPLRTYLYPILPLALAGQDLTPEDYSQLQHHPVGPEQHREGLQLYRASDSMQTTLPSSIHENDLIFVDTRDTQPAEGKIYVATSGKITALYRARYIEGELYLSPENHGYLPVKASEARITGRVYSSLRLSQH